MIHISEKPTYEELLKRVLEFEKAEPEHKQTEKTLRESEDIYRKAFMTSPDSIVITRLSDGMFVSINKGFTEITGYEEEDIIGKTSLEINFWGNPEDRIKIIEGLQDKGEVRNYEARFLAKDREFYGLMSASIIELNGVPHILNVTRDITDRKQAEDALRSSDSHFRRIVSTVPVMLYDYILYPDGSNRFIYVSPNCYDILEREEKELLQDMDVFWKMVHPDDVERLHREDIAANLAGRSFNAEVRIITKFERMKWVQLSSRPNPATPGAPTIWSGYVLDITERKQAEEALLALLEEKEVLLKEVHHRVKNNLAAIMGLLDMQGQLIVDKPARAAMAELSNRIRSMSLIHEQLYQSENLSRIDFQDYLEALVNHLHLSYQHSGNIHISVAAKGVKMGLDKAVPCGLLITELVTNAFKYAFPAGQPCSGAVGCEIAVSAEWDGSTYTLTVADNGVGLPAGLDWTETKTLGLLLVKMLGQHQLQGRVELDRTGGTTFRLRFVPPNCTHI